MMPMAVVRDTVYVYRYLANTMNS